jgi:hypothetical protein
MEFFRKRCEHNPKLVTDVSDKFLRIAEKLDYFVTNSRLNAVTKISHTRLLAVSIMLSNALDESRKLLIIKEWEKVTFRIFGLYRKDARTKVGEYVRLSREIFKAKNISSTEIVEKITALGQDYPASGIGKELGDTNCYEGWEDELVYFLYRYEENLTRTYGGSISDEVWVQVWNSSPTKTIEHIHPQKLNEHWRGKLGIKTDYVERQAQRLGNLILLPPGVNSSASDKSFKYKKEIYEKHRHLKIIDEVIAKDDWNIDSLKEREDKLIAWAQKEWE